MANRNYSKTFLDNAVRGEITTSIVNVKANVCPMTVRLAWHASGTFDNDDKTDKCGGSDGATMRFDPELADDANAGLGIIIDLLKPVKKKFPNLSYADIWTLAGAQAIKLCGGPDVKFNFGRTDKPDGTTCPANGRLPDASQGAQHLRDVFCRMGFNDKEIVCLSGAHTLGSCHESRSGYDGPWTTNPLKFDNEYFKNLLELEWTKREWDGPEQFTDPSGKLMMLPTDIALTTDPEFLPHVKAYAEDEQLFFKDFAEAFAKLISLGCPGCCQMNAPSDTKEAEGKEKEHEEEESVDDKDFRDLAMHGSLDRMKKITNVNPNSKEQHSGRTPMHKAAFFGHAHVIDYLINEHKADVNVQDANGDTPLHDASRLGHVKCVESLLRAGAKRNIKNNNGETPMCLAKENDKKEVVQLLGHHACSVM